MIPLGVLCAKIITTGIRMNQPSRQPRHSRIRRACSALVGLLLVGYLFQWELAQVGAWSNMLAEFSQTETVARAIQDTFSGKKPCSMCKTLTAQKIAPDSESALANPVPPRPVLFVPALLRLTFPLPHRSGYHLRGTLSRVLPVPEPPVPPPRSFSC